MSTPRKPVDDGVSVYFCSICNVWHKQGEVEFEPHYGRNFGKDGAYRFRVPAYRNPSE